MTRGRLREEVHAHHDHRRWDARCHRGAFAVRESAAERARNHSAMPFMWGSKSPGTEMFSTPARFAVRFSKSCGVFAGAMTSEPFGASIHLPPTKKLIVPSMTKKTSS